MKEKINKLINILIIIFAALGFIYSSIITKSLNESIVFIYKVIIPSLFPFMIFINLVLYSDAINMLAKLLKPLSKIFRLSSYGLICIIASLLGGYPYSAILVTSFVKKNKITYTEGERIIKYTFFPSFSYLFLVLYKIDSQTIYIIISLYIASFLLLFISSLKKENKGILITNTENKIDIFFEVMDSSFKAIFTIAFCIFFFSFISSFLSIFLKNEKIVLFLSGLLEFSKSSIIFANIPNKNFLDYILLNIIISFSSFSIIFQSMFYLKEISFTIKKILLSRFLIIIISTFILLIIFLLK